MSVWSKSRLGVLTSAIVLMAAGFVVFFQWFKPEDIPESAEISVPAATQQGPAITGTDPESAVMQAADGASMRADIPAAPSGEVDISGLASATQDAPAVMASADTVRPMTPLPVFDLVRVDPFGDAVVAGSTLPGQQVKLLLDGTEVATTAANDDGEFVAFFDVAPSETPQALGLLIAPRGQSPVASEETVLISPFTEVLEASEEDVSVSSAKGAGQLRAPRAAEAVQPSDTESAPLPEAASAGTPEAVFEAAPGPRAEAPKLLVADETSVRVLQSEGSGPQVMDRVVLDTITYDAEGGVTLAGRGRVDRAVRLYIDNKSVGTVRSDPDGAWRTSLPDVDVGVYTLRVDELDAKGNVTSRFETPFRREEIAAIEDTARTEAPEQGAQVSVLTVQPGFTLWGIARRSYGKGRLYVRVFEANRDQIRDPDLIYPGQIFTIPN